MRAVFAENGKRHHILVLQCSNRSPVLPMISLQACPSAKHRIRASGARPVLTLASGGGRLITMEGMPAKRLAQTFPACPTREVVGSMCRATHHGVTRMWVRRIVVGLPTCVNRAPLHYLARRSSRGPYWRRKNIVPKPPSMVEAVIRFCLNRVCIEQTRTCSFLVFLAGYTSPTFERQSTFLDKFMASSFLPPLSRSVLAAFLTVPESSSCVCPQSRR